MANLSDLFQLDPTSGANNSNSNYAGANIQELCAPSGLNNALRALGSMAARALCYKSADISASVSTNIAAASTGLYMSILGANAINSFGVVPGEKPSAAVFRILDFSSSASLSHGPSLRLIGSASRKVQPGDVSGFIHTGSGDAWVETFRAPAIEGPRVAFKATPGSQTDISDGATQIAFTTEVFDLGSCYASNVWTPPAGMVRVEAEVLFNSISGSIQETHIGIYENSVTVALSSLFHRDSPGRVTATMHVADIFQTDGTKGYSIFGYCRAASTHTGLIASTAVSSRFFGQLL